MENKKTIPDEVINLVMNEIGTYPSFIHTPKYTHEGFIKLIEGSKKIWVNEYIDESEIVRFEGLYNYKDSGIFIYYQCDEKTYNFIFMSEVEKTDTLIFTIKALNKYKIQLKWK